MEKMILNGIYYAVEFIKLGMISAGLFSIRYKRNGRWLFAASVIFMAFIAPWRYIPEGHLLGYTLCMYLVYALSMEKKKDIGWLILSGLIVTIVDVVCSTIVFILIPALREAVLRQPIEKVSLNMISLPVFLCISFLWSRKRKSWDFFWKHSDAVIFIVCAAIVFILMAPLQLWSVGYRKKISALSIVLMVVLFAVSLALLWIKKQREQEQMEKELAQELVKIQETYYKSMLQKEESTKQFRHDIREYLFCIRELQKREDYDALGVYLEQMENRVNAFSATYSTGNEYVDMILNNLATQYPEVAVEVNGKIPRLKMEELDLCSLFYNLLKNAFEAADEAEQKKITLQFRVQGTNAVFEVSNQCSRVEFDERGELRTTKEGDGHGYGLKNIKRCVEKYKGRYCTKVDNNRFETEIIFLDIVEPG